MKLHLFACLLAAASLTLPARAAETPTDLPFRVKRLVVTYSVNADGTATTDREATFTLLAERALEDLRESNFSHSTSVEEATVVAYTLKADGRRIDVPPGNFQVKVNSGKDAAQAAFSDQTNTTVIFPELAVGDSVVWSYRLHTKQPIFPGQFSAMEKFAPQFAYDEVLVRLDAPKAMALQARGVGMQETRSQQGERQITEWRWSNPEPKPSKRQDYSVFDPQQQPSVYISTFPNHAAIARAYGERATPKAAVTPEIQALADRIAPGKRAERETARLLYDWVATQIDYAGNCIGVGAVVPRDLAFVVGNHMGDCKDHATLLQALLAAKGIASTQALVNASDGYELLQVPVVSQVNHVINYIPSLDLFVDATASTIPFGLLPMAVADKPVLLVDGHRDGLRTPKIRPSDDTQRVRSTLTLDEQGGVKGEMTAQLTGLAAAEMRELFRKLSKEQEADLYKYILKRQSLEGSGVFTHDDPKPLLPTFSFTLKFEIKGAFDLPGPGGMAATPFLSTPNPVAVYAASAAQVREDVEQGSCHGGHSVEEYVINLPKTVTVRTLPQNVSAKSDLYTYTATYARSGQQITVRREFDDRTPGQVCQIAELATQRHVGDKALKDLRAQILYEPTTP